MTLHTVLIFVHGYIVHALSSPFASGGLVLMVLGGAAALLRSIPGRIWSWVKDRVTTTVTVKQIDPLFDWLCLWMSSQSYADRCRSLMGSTTLRGQLRTRSNNRIEAGSPSSTARDDDPPPIHLLPSHGVHAFRHCGVWVLLNRDSGGQAAAGPNGGGLAGMLGGGGGSFLDMMKTESIALTFGTTDRALVRSILDEARALANPPGEVKTRVYLNRYGSWQCGNELPRREPESIILPAGEYERLTGDIETFWGNLPFYRRVGMPHRRSYLLTGKPGTGKTSLIRALAAEHRCALHVLNLSEDGLTDSGLATLLADLNSDRSIVAIEDIDSYFDGRQPRSENLKVTFSGLLNAIDGAAACEGRILIMTTNHREGLDDALVRPGRVDYELDFTYADKDQMRRMFSRFKPDASDDDYHNFEMAIWAEYGDRPITTAQLQGWLYSGWGAELFARPREVTLT